MRRREFISELGSILVAWPLGAHAQPAALTASQLDVLRSYNNKVNDFKTILRQRRAQINAKQQLPSLSGQALYLARNSAISTYKDLTDVLPSKIGKPNKFGIPPAGLRPRNASTTRFFPDLVFLPLLMRALEKLKPLRAEIGHTWHVTSNFSYPLAGGDVP